MKKQYLGLLCLAVILFGACASQKMEENQGHKESIPPKITNLAEFKKVMQGKRSPEEMALLEKIAKYETQLPGAPLELAKTYRALGNPESKKVIVYAQGGPASQLHPLGIALFIEKGELDLDKYLLLHVKQQSMIDAQHLFDEPIDFEEAKQYNRQNVTLLRNVVEFLQGQERQVSLLGISLGAYAMAEYLKQYGNDVYRMVFNVGRLDTPERATELASQGHVIIFSEDGKDVSIRELPPWLPSPIKENFSRINGAVGAKDYTQELADIDWSNAIYVYASNDRNVGRLSEAELAFL